MGQFCDILGEGKKDSYVWSDFHWKFFEECFVVKVNLNGKKPPSALGFVTVTTQKGNVLMIHFIMYFSLRTRLPLSAEVKNGTPPRVLTYDC